MDRILLSESAVEGLTEALNINEVRAIMRAYPHIARSLQTKIKTVTVNHIGRNTLADFSGITSLIANTWDSLVPLNLLLPARLTSLTLQESILLEEDFAHLPQSLTSLDLPISNLNEEMMASLRELAGLRELSIFSYSGETLILPQTLTTFSCVICDAYEYGYLPDLMELSVQSAPLDLDGLSTSLRSLKISDEISLTLDEIVKRYPRLTSLSLSVRINKKTIIPDHIKSLSISVFSEDLHYLSLGKQTHLLLNAKNYNEAVNFEQKLPSSLIHLELSNIKPLVISDLYMLKSLRSLTVHETLDASLLPPTLTELSATALTGMKRHVLPRLTSLGLWPNSVELRDIPASVRMLKCPIARVTSSGEAPLLTYLECKTSQVYPSSLETLIVYGFNHYTERIEKLPPNLTHLILGTSDIYSSRDPWASASLPPSDIALLPRSLTYLDFSMDPAVETLRVLPPRLRTLVIDNIESDTYFDREMAAALPRSLTRLEYTSSDDFAGEPIRESTISKIADVLPLGLVSVGDIDPVFLQRSIREAH